VSTALSSGFCNPRKSIDSEDENTLSNIRLEWSQSKDPVTVYDRGMALMDLGRYAEAMEAFGRSVQIGGMGSAPQLQLGVCQWRLGQHEEAARIIESVTLLEPHNERAGRLLKNLRAELASDFYRTAMGGTPITDKVTTHQYHILYDQVLARYRNTPGVHLLEIGLGCDMSYGPGASLGLWRRYFSAPDRKISFFENDRKCAEDFRHEVEKEGGHMFIGEQGKVEDLSQVDQWGPFDIIIDDGSHRMRDQVTSWHYLWKHVKPGGVYVIEDLHTSWSPKYGGVQAEDLNMFLDQSSPESNTYTRMAHTLFHLVHRGRAATDPQSIRDCDLVTCGRESCAFHKSRAE